MLTPGKGASKQMLKVVESKVELLVFLLVQRISMIATSMYVYW